MMMMMIMMMMIMMMMTPYITPATTPTVLLVDAEDKLAVLLLFGMREILPDASRKSR
jgi:hypothetical protein